METTMHRSDDRQAVRKDMKKIAMYYCVFFIGSLLPFLIAELYFRDYAAFGVISVFTAVILSVVLFLEYMKIKLRLWPQDHRTKMDLSLPAHQEKDTQTASYFFKNIWF